MANILTKVILTGETVLDFKKGTSEPFKILHLKAKYNFLRARRKLVFCYHFLLDLNLMIRIHWKNTYPNFIDYKLERGGLN